MILLPRPKKVLEREGALCLRFDTMIALDASCPADARVFGEMLREDAKKWAGLTLGVTRGAARRGDVALSVDASLGADTYRLTVSEKGAALTGGSRAALGWAVQTMCQLLRQSAGLVPFVEIEDEPDYKNRGFYHDLTRGRVQTLENLKRLADTAAFYKLNQLQLYVEHTYLFRDLTELWRDETPLTADEILELDEYCAARGVELVPSLASFGHLHKLLSTRSCASLCELPDSAGKPFYFIDRMDHHTVDVTNPDALALIERMIDEYMQLFRTDKFNLCADETFDLGKGRSSKAAEERGAGVLYFEYVCKLFDFLTKRGKTPMFWGDIITKNPELCSQLPPETICLTWGYAPQQSDREVRIMHEAGAAQYVCPGACGWNRWINILHNSYENVRRMCGYGRQYGALGVLNTDWGDFGHINQPIFSIPGLIYGAAFSWSEDVPDFDELNREISILEFGDPSGRLVGLWDSLSEKSSFPWRSVVLLKEWTQQGTHEQELRGFIESPETQNENPARAAEYDAVLQAAEEELRVISRGMDTSCRGAVEKTHAAIEMMRVWNEVGTALLALRDGRQPEAPAALAARIERIAHTYQRLWRENGKEGDLGRLCDVFFWYADRLRDCAAAR